MKILLIDGKYFCYRAITTQFHLSYKEIQTGVHYGWWNSVKSITKKIKPDNVIVMWDSSYSYRKELFPSYKSKLSGKKDENLINQLRVVKEESTSLRKTIANLGIVGYLRHGFEADDLFAAFTCDYTNLMNGDEIIIATSDEDMYQLLNENTKIYDPKKKTIKDYKWFKKKYEMEPYQWVEVKAIGGCKSDKVPGVKGVSTETAIAYMQQKEISKRAGYLINDGKEDITFYRKIVELPFRGKQIKKLRYKQTHLNLNKFIDYCQTMGFNSFLKEINDFKIFCYKRKEIWS